MRGAYLRTREHYPTLRLRSLSGRVYGRRSV
jgi:hypothetical protein